MATDPTHWTYAPVSSDADLHQGDILRRSDELVALLKEVHHHFCNAKYLGFVVLTQSCDLVQRGENLCKTEHITLAVIRSLEDIAHSVLGEMCPTASPTIYDRKMQSQFRRFLSRLINQNDWPTGLFYLHPDLDAGVSVASVVVMRVSISLRREHYDLLMAARTGRLTPQFEAKLGWIAGNLFSRVGTPDWSDYENGKKEADDIVNNVVTGDSLANELRWSESGLVRAAVHAKKDLSGLSSTELEETLSGFAPAPPADVAAARVVAIARDLMPELADDVATRLERRLRSDGQFRGQMKK